MNEEKALDHLIKTMNSMIDTAWNLRDFLDTVESDGGTLSFALCFGPAVNISQLGLVIPNTIINLEVEGKMTMEEAYTTMKRLRNFLHVFTDENVLTDPVAIDELLGPYIDDDQQYDLIIRGYP